MIFDRLPPLVLLLWYVYRHTKLRWSILNVTSPPLFITLPCLPPGLHHVIYKWRLSTFINKWECNKIKVSTHCHSANMNYVKMRSNFFLGTRKFVFSLNFFLLIFLPIVFRHTTWIPKLFLPSQTFFCIPPPPLFEQNFSNCIGTVAKKKFDLLGVGKNLLPRASKILALHFPKYFEQVVG